MTHPMPGYPSTDPRAAKRDLIPVLQRQQQSGKLLNVGRLSSLCDVQFRMVLAAGHCGIANRLERHGNALTLRIGGAH